MLDLNEYADIKQVIKDPEYAKMKNLKVYENSGLYLIKYVKTFINDENVKTLGLFRSVITDGEKILSIAPPKSFSLNKFKNMYKYDDCELQEYPEGTMINVFFNHLKDEWEIATKSNIGAKCTFNTEKTFRTMFLEAMNNNVGLEFDNLNSSYSYSFVLQHPDNKIVVPLSETKLILCGVYGFNDFKFKNMLYATSNITELFIAPPTPLHIIKNLDKKEDEIWDDLYEKIKSVDDYKLMGYVVVNKKTGERTKIRNEDYEYVKKLKGNNLKLQYTYYNLRQHGNVKQYLKYYPEQSENLMLLRKSLHDFTKKLYDLYVSCFIKKDKMLKEYPFKFKQHMYNLHQLFLNNLRGTGKYVTLYTVKTYVNTLPIPKLMFSMNYDENKRRIEEETINLENKLNE
jgi:hypothetical protein